MVPTSTTVTLVGVRGRTGGSGHSTHAQRMGGGVRSFFGVRGPPAPGSCVTPVGCDGVRSGKRWSFGGIGFDLQMQARRLTYWREGVEAAGLDACSLSFRSCAVNGLLRVGGWFASCSSRLAHRPPLPLRIDLPIGAAERGVRGSQNG